MSDTKTTPSTLQEHLSRIGQIGGKNGSHDDKVAAGTTGARNRWGKRPLCPTCLQPATEAQIKAGKTVTKLELESRKNGKKK